MVISSQEKLPPVFHFFLYKETDEKVTLSKKELENRMQGGGYVFDRQMDYMEYVNRQIFGFETVEEYKEMVDREMTERQKRQ